VRIRHVAKQAERRIRLRRATDVASKALCVAFAAAVVNAALSRAALPAWSPRAPVFAFAIAVAVTLAVLVAWGWRVDELAGARALDRFHVLSDRLSSSLSFAKSPLQTAFMRAAIEDAAEAADRVKPGRAVPVPFPRSLPAAVALAALWAGVLLFPVSRSRSVVAAATLDAVAVAPDDLDDLKQSLSELSRRNVDADTKTAVDAFNQLVDDIAANRLDRAEVFRRMDAIERGLLSSETPGKDAFERHAEALGDDLRKADLSRPTGTAMARRDFAQAADAMRDLAKKIRSPTPPVDPAKLDALREALKAASERSQKNEARLAERRRELAEEILKMKQKTADGGTDDDADLLKNKERELERLDRDASDPGEAGRQLDRLDRDLDQAAEDLMKDLGMSASDLDKAAEDLDGNDQQQRTQQEKEELRQELQQLRELLRQQGQGGKGRLLRLQRFGRAARGQRGGGQGTAQGNDPGPGSGQQGQDPGPAKGSENGQTWVLGPGGEKMLMLTQGSAGASPGISPMPGGEGTSRARWGEGHDPHVQGKATRSDISTADTQVAGVDTGQGLSRSQVIETAAERGFVSRDYRRVFDEYHQVAEESLAKDEVPGGYRFYVKRYFQLIRPREAP
jgi:hypothetical protein